MPQPLVSEHLHFGYRLSPGADNLPEPLPGQQ